MIDTDRAWRIDLIGNRILFWLSLSKIWLLRLINYKKAARLTMYIIATSFACYVIILNSYYPKLLSQLCREDSSIQYLTALLYFLSSIIFAHVFTKKGARRILYCVFALLFFFIAGEEISWGQRLFGFATPECLSRINLQNETTFHNIDGIHGNIRWIGLLVVLGICYIIPISNRFLARLRNFYRKIKMPIYPLWLIFLPTISILFMALPRFIFHDKHFNFDEIGEFYLAISFWMFSLSNLKQIEK